MVELLFGSTDKEFFEKLTTISKQQCSSYVYIRPETDGNIPVKITSPRSSRLPSFLSPLSRTTQRRKRTGQPVVAAVSSVRTTSHARSRPIRSKGKEREEDGDGRTTQRRDALTAENLEVAVASRREIYRRQIDVAMATGFK